MNKNWVVIGRTTDPNTDKLVNYITERSGVTPKHYSAYGTMLSFLVNSGMDTNRAIAYKDGIPAGYSVEELEFTFKWLEGEPNVG